jgi:acyl-CoA synthetase (AMP-forming)/AMP-acid ligase II
MLVPLTTQDFLARGVTVYPDRVAVVDEPDQPAPSLGELTFAQLHDRARAVAAGLDAMGVAAGERIAVVSQNSARMLDLFYGATATGRIVVPINFRLGRDEVDYIVDHSQASVLLVDPDLQLSLARVRAPRRLTLGTESDATMLRFGVEPRPWNNADENATATLNYTSGTTARPKGVELTRLVSPQQYGFVSTKHLCRVDLYTVAPSKTFGRGPLIQAHPRARVWKEERHRYLPAQPLRPIYRMLIPPFRFLSARGSRAANDGD